MSYRVSDPVIDEALSSFLLFVLVLVVSVAVVVSVGSYLGVLEPSTIVERMGGFAIDLAVTG